MKQPWEFTLTQWMALPPLYGEGPYWREFHRAIMARCNFQEAVAAASRLKESHASPVRTEPRLPPHTWTATDKDLVRTDYDGTKKSMRELADKIGVTRNAVRAKVTKLKVGRKPGSRSWSEADKDIVRKEYDGTGTSVAAIAAKVNRTLIAVKGQVQSLNLAKREHRDWTPTELEYLRDTYGILPDEQICQHLNRSRNGIVLAAKRLLHINRKSNFYTAEEVARILGLSCPKIITKTWIEKGFIEGKKSPTRCGLNLMWLFSELAIEECLKEHPWLVVFKKVKDHNEFRKIIEDEWKRDPWYNTEQAATLLGLHPHTVVRYLNHGVLEGVKKPALAWQGEWVIRRSAIHALLEKRVGDQRDCRCGHSYTMHHAGQGRCYGLRPDGRYRYCRCKKYKPRKGERTQLWKHRTYTSTQPSSPPPR
jgi:hypothetical protein